MGELYTYNATHLTTVREAEFTQCAENGAVGSFRLGIDDTDGTLSIVGQKNFAHTESSCSFTRTFQGFIGDREYGRDAGNERAPHVGAARGIGVSGQDLNATLGFRMCRITSGLTAVSAGNRPAETVAERGAWLMASPFMSGLVADNGRCSFPSTKGMDAADYRGQFPGDVLADMALAALGYNYYVADWGSGAELVFRDDNVSTADTSTLRISNVLADASGVTLHPLKDAVLRRDPSNVISHVRYGHAKNNINEDRAATATTFNGERSGSASNSNIKTDAKAREEAVDLLYRRSTEEDIIECTVVATSAQVNLILHGHRIEAKFSHLATEGYGSFTWFRVLERSVKPTEADAGEYELRLKLSPQEAAEVLPAAYIVQSAFANGIDAGVVVTLPNPVTIGNLLVVWVADRAVRLPIAPNTQPAQPRWGAGAWTRLNSSNPTATLSDGRYDGCAMYYKVADATDQSGWYAGGQVNIGVWEIAGGNIAAATLVTKDEQSGAAGTYPIGSLGTAATGSVALMGIIATGLAGYQHEYTPLVSVDSGVWTQRWYKGALGWSFFDGPAQGSPISWIGDTEGAGVALTASIDRNPTHWTSPYFAGLALLIPPL